MSRRPTPETDAERREGLIRGIAIPTHVVSAEFAEELELQRDEALAIGQELADISSHCLGWHIDVAGNFKSDHTLGLSRKITNTLQRWAKLKEAMK
jgi:hypothetical protein